MYAILQQGGHQYRVAPGDRLLVDRLGAEVGSVINLAPVLLIENDGATTVGRPVIEGARVAATIVAHPLGAKLRVFTYKPKKRHRRTFGHRSRLTELRVDALLGAGEAFPGTASTAVQPARTPRGGADAASEEGTPTAGASARAPRRRRSTGLAPVAEEPEQTAPETVVEAPAEAAGAAEEQPSSASSRRPRRTSRPASPTSAETEE
jgi:large subunit ribosomal protein L21